MLYTRYVIGPFKRPRCTSPDHANFNYQLARLRVKSEHTIGIVKGRWASLKELRLTLATDGQFGFAMKWIVASCVLHNICLDEGDGFPDQPRPDPSPSATAKPSTGASARRQEILCGVSSFMRGTGIYRENV